MPPSPGDPSNRPTDPQPSDVEMEDQSEAARNASVYLNFATKDLRDDNEILKRTAAYWNNIAEKLRSAGYPLYLNRRNKGGLDPSLLGDYDAMDRFLDELIPLEGINNNLTLHKLTILITGGEIFEDFTNRMRSLDYSLKCNEIWENDSVAYRCNTCAMTPCMSLCADCFLSNGHDGHDFTRFFSREGGACDCGNDDVLKSDGFCSRHGKEAVAIPRQMPPVAIAEFIYVKLIVRLFLLMRGFQKKMNTMQQPSIATWIGTVTEKTAPTINYLQKLVNLGGPMRIAMTRILTDAQLYEYLTEETGEEALTDIHTGRQKRLLLNLDFRTGFEFRQDQAAMLEETLTAAFEREMGDREEYMRCETLLHEFLFWIFRLSFPQGIINFILSMLSDPDYLNMMAFRFFQWYPLATNLMRNLCKEIAKNEPGHQSGEVSQVASRIIHVSVQMLSSSALCCRLDAECDLVGTIYRSAVFLLSEVTIPTENILDSGFLYLHNMKQLPAVCRQQIKGRVIQAENNDVISHHGYWFVMGDIQNVMSHTQLAVQTVKGPAFDVYIQLATLMQGMNTYWRIVSGDHALNDAPENAQRTFTMEYETLSITMFNFVMAILADNNIESAQLFLLNTGKALKAWIQDVVLIKSCTGSDDLPLVDIRSAPVYSFSVHLPLHRHFSTAISHFYNMKGVETIISILREEEAFLRLIALHPVRIHVFRAEHHCGMWVRNGQQLRLQSMLYAQPHINTSFFQPDLDLIRFCGANVKGEWFISMLIESYHLDDVFDIEDYYEPNGKEVVTIEEDDVPGRYSPDPSGTRQTIISQKKYNIISGQKQLNYVYDALKTAMLEEGIIEDVKIFNLNYDNEIELIRTIVTMAEEDPSLEADPERRKRREELHEKMKAVNIKVKSNDRIKSLLQTMQEAQRRTDKICEARPPGAPQIGLKWMAKDAMILKRQEWIDPLLQNCLLLIAELLVIRINCGATEKESMRAEMVHELAGGKMKYSNLRTCITDKGGRSALNIEFPTILKEIADYHDPDEGRGAANQLQQGGYTLKPETWHTDFCPVFAQMRAVLPGRAQEVLLKAEEHDLKNMPAAQKSGGLWIPYRMYNQRLKRHETTENIIKILFTERFTQLLLLIIESKKAGFTYFSENTLQLVIYLITLTAHEASCKEASERLDIYNQFHKMYSVKMEGVDDRYEICIFQSIYRYFMAQLIKKGNVLEMLEKIMVGSFNEERIVGGELEYIGRFLSVMISNDDTCKRLLESDIQSYKELKKEEDSKIDKEVDKKLAMKRRNQAIMELQKAKGAKLMEKHRENEGLSLDEVNAMDITNRKVNRYDCPICGDNEIPSTLHNPMGMMASVVNNNLADNRVHEGWEQPTLLESLTAQKIFPQKKSLWHHLEEKDLNTIEIGALHGNVLGPCVSTEIQTCGHTAHVECFKQFQQSQTDTLRQDYISRGPQVLCPLCRIAVNSIIPMKIDVDYGTSDIGDIADSPERIFNELKKTIMSWRKVTTENRDLLHEHYVTKTDKWMELMAAEEKERYDKQTTLAALIRGSIERILVYRKFEVPERRKNGWSMPLVHLIPPMIYNTTKRSEAMCLQAVRDLFIPDSVQINRSNSDTAIASTSHMEFSLEEDLIILGMEPKRHKAQESEQKIDQLMTNRSDTALLLFDFRLLFIRIGCFVIENDTLKDQDKYALLRSLADRILHAGGIRTAMILLHRLSLDLGLEFVEKTGVQPFGPSDPMWFMKNVCDWFRQAQHQWMLLKHTLGISNNSETFYEEWEVIDVLKKNVADLREFCDEFIQMFMTSVGITKEMNNGPQDFSSLAPISRHWIRWLVMALNTAKQMPNQTLYCVPLAWSSIQLLQPPKLYDDLFTKLHKKTCDNCDRVPQTPFICMHCGQLVCYDDCCKTFNSEKHGYYSEVQTHAENCTGATCIFLALNSAVVVLIRGKYGAVWGSIYLDAHGEEDRNLRRGKQLYLSDSRLRILQNDWAGQNFDRVQAWYVTNLLYNLALR